MTITLTRTKVVSAIFVFVLLLPAAAQASHVFDDVADNKFYATPVEWAFDNGITTGRSGTSFAPEDGVTRGESVTFLKRYEDNVVDPTRGHIASQGFGVLEGWDGTTLTSELGMEVPRDGMLMVTHTLNVGRTLTETVDEHVNVVVELAVDDDAVALAFDTVDHTLSGTSEYDTVMTTHGVIPVTAGSRYVTAAFAHDGSAGSDLVIYGDRLTAVFYPNDAQIPLSLSPTSADGLGARRIAD